MKKILLSIALCIFISLATSYLYIQSSEQKTGYMNLSVIYKEFSMKKELENTFTKIQTQRKEALDSMELELELLNKRLNAEGEEKDLVAAFEKRRENYLQYKKQFQDDNELMQQQYTEKINKQLNQYVIDYGKEKDYDYLLGGDGTGTVMFAKDGHNITEEVLEYINKKYQGSR
jgi:outer membrane protein